VLPGEPVPLRIFDTATGELRPSAPGTTASLYVCGITPYDATHLGHAATYVAFDVLQRVWRDNGHAVRYVQNVTDVDEPLLERATRDGVDWAELAERETALFRDDMTALAVLPPDVFLGATEAIPEIAAAVAALLEKGAAYDLDGDIYFSVAADPRFGAVSGYDVTTMLDLSTERGGDPRRPGKKDPLDPVLWRAARPGEPSWDVAADVPFGPGRPGWHIECTAIALEHLGMPFDVQGGGRDLTFPHHEMGAAHAHALSGSWPFARTYVHTGMVGLDGEKMSKSRGNLVFVSRLRADDVDPMAIRLALLAHHYRGDWEWRDIELTAAQERLDRWRAAVSREQGPATAPTVAAVRAALADDLDTPRALAALDRWADEQRMRGGDEVGATGVVARLADALLGVRL
jgi:L-cysteine:1D-myo-inositol 2-amino-2-deoxy-alpha-D-glucopyranoside ligase